MEKIKQKIILLFVLMMLITLVGTNYVKANEWITKEFPTIGMKIEMEPDLIDVVEKLKQGDESLPDYQPRDKFLRYFEQSGILLNAVDRLQGDPTRQLMVVQTNHQVYWNVPNLKSFTEEQLNQYYEGFVQSAKEQAEKEENGMQIQETELVKTQNGNVYIHVQGTGKIDEKPVGLSVYYTIMNYRLITISYRAINQEVNQPMISQMIEGITFDTVQNTQRQKYLENQKIVWTSVISIVSVFAIVFFLIRRKDKKKMGDTTNLDKTTKKYLAFGGILTLFAILCFYQIWIRGTQIYSILNVKEGYEVYQRLLILQCVVIMVLSCYQGIRVFFRKEDTPKKLQIALVTSAVFSIVIAIIRMIYAKLNPAELYTNDYFEEEANNIFTQVFYAGIWCLYFQFSDRVRIYYHKLSGITLDELIAKVKQKMKRKKK